MSTTRERETARPITGRRPARRTLLVCAAALLAIVVAAIAGLALGDYPLTTDEVIGVLTGRVDGLARTVVLDWRLPRVLAAIGFGAALGVSGAIFQTLTRNPLASPDIIGLANGSFTGMLVALLLLGGSWPALMAGSLIGGLAAAVAIFLLALRQGLSGFRFIVVGIGVSAMLAAFNSWLLLRADLDVALFAAAWGAGTLNTATATVVWPALACLVVLFAVLPFAARPLRQLELGDDVAAATGVRLTRERAILIGLAVALVSAVTAVAGPIAFIALAAPQIARRLTRSPGIPLVATGLVGGVLLLASDLVAQHLIPLTVPVGVVTVVVGGLYLTQLLLRERRR
ncbi:MULTISPECIES: FecCD family ABC transporter permease [unclassified Plantibacter]|uniref:FecCD family ABC transporter permease n=1 Tax=unclassified Plantibacter TaxID=2624265 RepID=UPI001780849B|nr:iron chelate uptake ABC transporter family permease subunit [Plantibacter sp. CFBP 13570]MBD8516451.1 iron chelate uptake ABC transporter family permease subunit [Plantibacter sp. CFBP 8804]MBD8534075.1 iron chelate uptake ABC transporter family permease subunit [Plantibacter sp. CFBP 13570]